MTERKGQGRSHGRLQPRVSATPRPVMGSHIGVRGAWRAKVLTIFPEMFPGPLGTSLVGKALKDGIWTLEALDIRRFARDKHRSVDDAPAGGGPGMVMRPNVIAAGLDFAQADAPADRGRWPVIYMSPRGRPLTQARAAALAAGEGATLLCGRFEGVDQRVLDARNVEEVSIGDFVLSGGEIAAMALIDAVVRLIPGALGNHASTVEESFSAGLLEAPHYTKPPDWDGRKIPEVLLSGHHARIAEWRQAQAEALTKERRPDLWRAYRESGANPDGDAEQSDAHMSAKGGVKKEADDEHH